MHYINSSGVKQVNPGAIGYTGDGHPLVKSYGSRQ
jgi:hypothetical protein